MGLFDSLFGSSEVLGIAEETLEFTLEASEAAHPNEYMGMLRGTEASRLGLDRSGLVITDVLVIPGTESNSVSATVKTNMIPNERNAVGSVHSHPNGIVRPSAADLQTFGRGDVHIIVGAPYRRSDWTAFDNRGEPTDLEVIDVELPDTDELFYFDPEEIERELEEEEDRAADDAATGGRPAPDTFGDDWPGTGGEEDREQGDPS